MTRVLRQRFPGELPRETTGFVGRDRELDALAGLLEAARMVTVTDAHIASIYGKLGISSRVQLVTWLGARSGGPPGDSG